MKKPRHRLLTSPLTFFREDRRWIHLIPIFAVLWVWASSLSFVPVPWPDDSAFYFPAKDLFAWPPRWVMIPQAPFEPTYREWNFNTMPLLPILIGILRAFGLAGTHALKILPLGGWLLGIGFVIRSLRRGGASTALIAAVASVLAFHPILRWSSVLIRPESIIGAMGILILYGFRFGWPPALRERKYFHPVSLFLLVGALLHFDAIHLVPIVLALYAPDWRKLAKIAALTATGLVPWLLTIAFHPANFIRQMALQFGRLEGYRNPWLSNWDAFASALLPDMGTPEPWSGEFRAGVYVCLVGLPLLVGAMVILLRKKTNDRDPSRAVARKAMIAGFTWFVSALYLWHTKAEVWFTHFFHLAFWAWATLVLFELEAAHGRTRGRRWALAALPVAVAFLFLYGQLAQTIRLEATRTWHWGTYAEWIDCIDGFLVREYERRGRPTPFRVWDPTYPDVTIALSQRHPDWEFTRTNDFFRRWDLGVEHGREVEAVVIPEIFRQDEASFQGEMSGRPGAASVWMKWDGYFLNRLERDPKFKPRRYLCQSGRWDAFIYFER